MEQWYVELITMHCCYFNTERDTIKFTNTGLTVGQLCMYVCAWLHTESACYVDLIFNYRIDSCSDKIIKL